MEHLLTGLLMCTMWCGTVDQFLCVVLPALLLGGNLFPIFWCVYFKWLSVFLSMPNVCVPNGFRKKTVLITLFSPNRVAEKTVQTSSGISSGDDP